MIKNQFSMALVALASMAAHKFGLPGRKFDCVASPEEIKGATIKRVSSKTYRPRSQRKRGGRG